MKKLIAFLTATFILIGIGGISAQTTKTWAGGTSTDWNTAANWSPSGVPATGDYVKFTGAGTYQPLMDQNRSVGNIDVSTNTVDLNGYTLTVTGSTQKFASGSINNGKVTFSGTTTTFGGTTFGAIVEVNSQNVTFYATTFNNKVDVTKTGASNSSSKGGNTFNDSLKLKTTSSGAIIMHATTTSGDDYFNGHVVVSNTGSGGISFGSTDKNGRGYLASGKTITIGSAGFSSGTLGFIQFTQSGSTAQSLTLTGSSTNLIFGGNGTLAATSTWNGALTVSAPNVLIANSTYNANATFSKTGGSSNTCDGNNTYNGTATFNVTSTGYLTLANTTGDTYNSDVNYNISSSATIYPANNGTNNYYGNVAIATNNLTVTFNNGSGTSVFTGSSSQTITKTGTGEIYISRLTMNKASNHVTISSPINISTVLTLTSGKIIATNATDTVRVSASSMPGGSSTSYIDAVILYRMNGSSINQTLPSGNGSVYQPLTIVNTGGMSGDYKFAARYYATGQSQGSSADTSVANLSDCEYWKLNQVSGTSVALNVTLGWKSTSCNGAKPANMRVSRWSGSQWVNAGNGANTGNNNAGTVRTASGQSTLGYFTVANKTCSYAATITPTGATSFCSGGSVLLTANSSKYYKWSTSATTQAITASSSATYSVTVRDTSGCKGTANQAVTVWALPVANAGTDTVIVVGDTIQLTGSASSGTSPYTYEWSPGTGLSSTTITNPNAYPTTGTNYIFKVTDTHGCIKHDTMKVWAGVLNFTVNTDTANVGDNITFTNTSTGFPPGRKFLWNFGDCSHYTSHYNYEDNCLDTTIISELAYYNYYSNGGYVATLSFNSKNKTKNIVVLPYQEEETPPRSCNFICGGTFNDLKDGVDEIDGPNQITSAFCWYGLGGGSPDLFNVDAIDDYNVPNNAFQGNENSFDGTNGGYAGLCSHESGIGRRDYMYQQLGAPIVPGQTVILKYAVSLVECSKFASELQAIFSDNLPSQNFLAVADISSINHSGLLTDLTLPTILTQKNGWTEVVIKYTNTTAYTFEYLTIGNFKSVGTSQSQTVSTTGCTVEGVLDFAYYYVDDVRVECTCPADYLIGGVKYSNDLLSDDYYDITGTVMTSDWDRCNPGTSKTISIDGTLVINSSFELKNANVILTKGSKIRVQNGRTLYITDSWLHACNDEMWDSIMVDAGGSLVIDGTSSNNNCGTLIEDALTAVGVTSGSVLTITDSELKNNYENVNLWGSLLPTTTISNTDFDATRNLLSPHTSMTTSRSGIKVRCSASTAQNITIGSTSQSYNYFGNLQWGILSQNANLTLDNNHFENIYFATTDDENPTTVNTANIPYTLSSAVYTWSKGGVKLGAQKPYSLTMGTTSNTTYKNLFNNCENGIVACGQVTPSIKYTGMEDINTRGIAIYGPLVFQTGVGTVQNVDISHNRIETVYRNGITVTGIRSAVANVYDNEVLNNDIKNGIGINLTEAFPRKLASYSIYDNTVQYVRDGIKMSTVSKFPGSFAYYIGQNFVRIDSDNLGPNTGIGINVENNVFGYIFDNNIVGDDAGESQLKGFNLSKNTAAYVTCNNIEDVGHHLFINSNNQPAFIQNNEMTDGLVSIFYNNNASTGAQGPTSADYYWNAWYGTFDYGFAFILSNGTQSSPWVFDNSSIEFNPDITIWTSGPIQPGSGTPPAFVLNTGSSTQPECVEGEPDAEECCDHDGGSWARMFINDTTFTQDTLENRWWSIYRAYETIKGDSLLNISTDVTIANFRNYNDTTNIGRLYRIYTLVANGEFKDANDDNGDIIPSNDIEEALVDFYDWYTDKFDNIDGDSISFTPSDTTYLYDLARSCPMTIGPAVYMARTLYTFINPGITFLNTCEGGTNNSPRLAPPQNTEATQSNKFSFFPNPALNVGYLAYRLETNEKATLQVFNMLGQPIEQKPLFKENNLIELPLDKYSNGLYLYTIIANGKLIYQSKFIVAKE
jgi:hypothetical protein